MTVFVDGPAKNNLEKELDIDIRKIVNRTEYIPALEKKEESSVEYLQQFFEKQVELRPNQVLTIHNGIELSYLEVEQRANRLAHYLDFLDIGKGCLVGLYLNRSSEALIAMLGILKSGAGYVPIDPSFPKERIEYIFSNASINTVVTEDMYLNGIDSEFSGNIVNISDSKSAIFKFPTSRFQQREDASQTDIAYVIYTSGTTGAPKGVIADHKNVVTFANSFNEVCKLTSEDRVYHGFSLAFDGSVEEIWMGILAGATLVIGDQEISKLGSEVAKLINEEQVTFFSTVPTFLSMISEELPTVKVLILSGEQCPPELVDRWATSSCRLLNVYGPTEATVNTTFEECKPGVQVTIGSAIKDYHTYILSEELQEVEPGSEGELFIGGESISRGYLGRDDLTAKLFIDVPNIKGETRRLYRTGDLVKENSSGKLLFLGRLDTQVKIRGYRIELSEIESVIKENDLVDQVVVNPVTNGGIKELAAFVVLNDSEKDLERDDLLTYLQGRLPVYMIPSYLDTIELLPTLASGKVDRKRLPASMTPLIRNVRDIVAPETVVEKQMVQIWEDIFKISPISIVDNFFLDLGGYSLLAAQVASAVREKLSVDIAIKDIYSFKTVRDISIRIEEIQKISGVSIKSSSSKEVFESVPLWERALCYTLQGLTLAGLYGGASAAAATFLLFFFMAVQGAFSWIELAKWSGSIAVLAFPLSLIMPIVFKWTIIGKYKPGKYPLWSIYYFRWWLVKRLGAFSGAGMFVGTPVMSLYYRLLGAKIGKNCTLDTTLISSYDLVSIGDDSSICSETQLMGYRVEDGMLTIGTVDIGARCFVGIHSYVGLNTEMEDDSKLGDLSMLPDGSSIEKNVSKKGAPAVKESVTVSHNGEYKRHPVLMSIVQLLSGSLLGLFFGILSLPLFAVTVYAYLTGGVPLLIGWMYLGIPVGVVWSCVSIALAKYLLLRKVKPGVYAMESSFYIRKWLVDSMIRYSTAALKPLYTTIYLPTWLRMLGAKIGKRAEIATVSQISPDLMEIDDESFFADGSIIGGRHFHRGYLQIDKSKIGKRSFIGNSAILPIGASIGDNALLGCLSAPPEGKEQISAGTEWLGSPSFELPYRKKEEGFSDEETFSPTKKLYIKRLVVDFFRIVTPGIIVLSTFLVFVFSIANLKLSLGVLNTILLSPLIGIGTVLLSVLAVVLLKKVLMGTFKPVLKPLWSMYVWLNELVNGSYESLFAPVLAPLLGTPFFAPFLRMLGCKIGKNVYLETTLFSEFDLVEVGDYAALNAGVIVQNHLFEDRIMKSDYLTIGDECSVGNMSVVLYDSEMKRGSSIGPLSLLMKGEILPTSSKWHGIPTSLVTQ